VVVVVSTVVAVQAVYVMDQAIDRHLKHFQLLSAQVELLAHTKVTTVVHLLWEA
jgi:hypothetical protein